MFLLIIVVDIYCRYFDCVAQLVERRSLTGELSLSCARLAADG